MGVKFFCKTPKASISRTMTKTYPQHFIIINKYVGHLVACRCFRQVTLRRNTMNVTNKQEPVIAKFSEPLC